MAEKKSFLIVAAIDFGTTYSGYAFSFRGDYEEDPLKIISNQAWRAGEKSLMSLKTPTTLLLDKNGEFVSFGYDAENKYTNLILDGEQEGYMYFQRFKMKLHNSKTLSETMVLEDITGREYLAVNVFSLSIKALKDHLMQTLSTLGKMIREEEIQWVLTVPAIWDDAAKQFMRVCAEKAGIQKDSLKIALEPEAASIYCQHLTLERIAEETVSFTVCKPGTKFMVIDLGGGTADITVHEKLQDGRLKELHKASGGACGGTAVDQQFLDVLAKIFGKPFMTRLQQDKENTTAYLDLMREFESVKRTIEPDYNGKLNMTLPYVILDTLCEEILEKDLSEIIKTSEYSSELTLLGDKLRIKADFAKSLFRPVTDAIVSHVRNIIENSDNKDLDVLLMVGGFSDCHMTEAAIRAEFPDMKIIIPEEAGLAVLRGAVIFGHRPDCISSRILRYSYGMSDTPEFDPSIHKPEYKIMLGGIARCRDVFQPIAEAGESIPLGHSETAIYGTTMKMQPAVILKIYVSPDNTPDYVTDESCQLLGEVKIEIQNPSIEDRDIVVNYLFGDTELHIIALEEEGMVPCISRIKMI